MVADRASEKVSKSSFIQSRFFLLSFQWSSLLEGFSPHLSPATALSSQKASLRVGESSPQRKAERKAIKESAAELPTLLLNSICAADSAIRTARGYLYY